MSKKLLFISILCLSVALRFYKLDEIPGEIFGDMIENYHHIERVTHGDFHILYGYDGREGMLFYLVAPFAFLLGNSYLTLKIVTAVIGLVSILVIYFFAREIVNEEVGLLASFLLAVSKWPLAYSRIGFRAVLCPLFVMLTFLFFHRALKRQKSLDFMLTGLFLGLGLYTYTAFRFVGVSFVFILGTYLFTQGKLILKNLKKFFLLFATCLIIAFPMIIDYAKRPQAYLAHPGPMLFKDGMLRQDWLSVLLTNAWNQSLMLHLRGDIVFRVNPPRSPHLDPISGIFFLVGAAYFLKKGRQQEAIFLFTPFFILQLPSILVLNVPIDIPSATRSIGVIPYVFLFVAVGIWWLFTLFRKQWMLLRKVALGAVLGSILLFNLKSYFVDYVYGLPNHNTPFGKVIASEIDALPRQTDVIVIGCCWGDWGQPEPGGIQYVLKKPRPITFVDERKFTGDLDCSDLKQAFPAKTGTNVYIIVNPQLVALERRIRECLPGQYEKMIEKNGFTVGWSYFISSVQRY